MSFWKNVSPTGAARDLKEVWSENPYRWRVLAVAVAATTGLMIIAIPESQRIEPRKPDITYITSFEPGRTDEQIIASNIANQEKQDAIRADQERRAEFRKDMYRQLGRATGLDVDAMEREIAQEEAAEKRAEEAERAALRDGDETGGAESGEAADSAAAAPEETTGPEAIDGE